MKLMRHSALIMLGLLLVACVTINVYFPAAAAEKAADRIIRDVYGDVPATETAPAPASPSGSSRHEVPLVIGALQRLVSPAQAAADISVQTPAIQQITASLEARHRQLAGFYASGAIGMTGNGLITVRDMNAVSLKDRGRLQQLVADENRERDALYGEIARANGHPEWESDIRATFARRWVGNAPSGWWYQDGAGGWKVK